MYSIFIDAEWEACTDSGASGAVCVNSKDGKDVLDGLSRIYPVIESENTVAQDIGIMLAIAMFWKLSSIAVILVKTRKVASINDSKVATISDRTKRLTRKVVETQHQQSVSFGLSQTAEDEYEA